MFDAAVSACLNIDGELLCVPIRTLGIVRNHLFPLAPPLLQTRRPSSVYITRDYDDTAFFVVG